ncbi:hypothetical protein ACFQZJ_06160 [Maribacter chungangensis]|uniref:Uncharacterized protein n=2 Tax=Maribacter chungangensis TaxID=1069117 RepID=A0ABW3B1V6_9FLAO
MTKRLYIFLAVIFMFTSCGKEDTPTIEDRNTEGIETKEESVDETPIVEEPIISEEANTITDNVIIVQSQKINGSLPAPNEVISMILLDTDNKALLNEGFSVIVDSNADISGAYIQFKTKGGGISDSYYKVDFESNSSGKVSTTPYFWSDLNKQYYAESNNTTSKDENAATIDIDFTSNIEPGEFCYIICVFDDAGNISGSQDVCVTILNWGGNDTLIGNWNFEKTELYSLTEETKVLPVGEEQCNDFEDWFCKDERTFDFTWCRTEEFRNFSFNEDGSFTFTRKSFGEELDFEASDVDCSPVIVEDERTALIRGNWSYDQETNTLNLVDYFIETYNYNSGLVTNERDAGEGRLTIFRNVLIDDEIFQYGREIGDNDAETGFRTFYIR